MCDGYRRGWRPLGPKLMTKEEREEQRRKEEVYKEKIASKDISYWLQHPNEMSSEKIRILRDREVIFTRI